MGRASHLAFSTGVPRQKTSSNGPWEPSIKVTLSTLGNSSSKWDWNPSHICPRVLQSTLVQKQWPPMRYPEKKAGPWQALTRYKLLSTISLGNTCTMPVNSFTIYSVTLLQYYPLQLLPQIACCYLIRNSCLVLLLTGKSSGILLLLWRIHNCKLNITFFMLILKALLRF